VLKLINEHIRICERVLAENVIEVARDLRLVAAADLVVWLRAKRFGNIAAIVDSSTELLFKAGVLQFDMSGAADLCWSGRLAIDLDMKFRTAGVECYFRLHLFDACAGVAMTYLAIDGAPCASSWAARRFIAALSDARLQRPGLNPVPGRSRKPGANEST
jgi:hypothetical protein